ncbi:MAG: MerR family DNA-binding transcriptional regulator [Gammaproteobacteria bacterium]|nr:MerR family DNA-binding transcriptional regulator [Gammaproteobacteria bacterium]
MSIGKPAKIPSVSVDTLRFYEKEYWLPLPARSSGDPTSASHCTILENLSGNPLASEPHDHLPDL